MKQTAKNSTSQIADGSFSFELIERDTIVFCKVRGYVTKELLEDVTKDSREYVAVLRKLGKPTLLLTDVSGVTGMSPGARRSMRVIRDFKIDKSAIYGAGLFLTMVVQYVLRLSKTESWNHVFRSKGEALRWLKGHKGSFQRMIRHVVARFLALLVIAVGLVPLVGHYLGNTTLQALGFPTGSIRSVIAAHIVLIGVALMVSTTQRAKKIADFVVRSIATWLVLFGIVTLSGGLVWLQKATYIPAVFSDAATHWPFLMLFVFFGLLLWQITYPLVRRLPSMVFRTTMIVTVLWALTLLVVDTFDLPFSSRIAIDITALVTAATIVLVVYRKPGRFPVARTILHHYWLGIVTFLVILAVAIAVWGNARGAAERSALSRTQSRIASEFKSDAEVLRSYRAFFNASELVKAAEFLHYTDELNLAQRSPGITSIMFVDSSTPSDYNLEYIAPSDTAANLGYNFADHQQARYILEKARDTGGIESGIVTDFALDNNTPIDKSLLAIAMYAPGVTLPETIEERRLHVRGFVVATFSMQAFLQSILTEPIDKDIPMTITSASTNTVYYQTSGVSPNSPPPVIVQSAVQAGGETWNINVLKKSFGVGDLFNGPNVFLAVGAVLGLFAAMAAQLLMYRRSQTQRLVRAITEDLGYERNRALALAQKDETIIGSIGEGLVVTDRLGRITHANDIFVRMTGWSLQDLLGRRLVDRVPMIDIQGDVIPASKRIITTVLSDRFDKRVGRKMMRATLADKMKYRRKDGSEFYVAITTAPVVADNKVDGVIQVVRDITQEVAIDQAKNDFISLASHQLRTPLTATKWYSELLLDGEAGHLTPKQRKYTQEALDATNRTIKLVNALLDVSRVETDTLGVYAEPTDIAQVLTKLVKDFTKEAKIRQLLISEDYAANLPQLQVDSGLLQAVITNLLTNAIKYTPEEGVITLTLREDRGGVVIAVSDTGYGIPSAQQDKIFTKMFRADNARLRVADGTGLGLYLAKSIADYAGCSMWFESTENKGSTFYLRIPKQGMERKHSTTEI